MQSNSPPLVYSNLLSNQQSPGIGFVSPRPQSPSQLLYQPSSFSFRPSQQLTPSYQPISSPQAGSFVPYFPTPGTSLSSLQSPFQAPASPFQQSPFQQSPPFQSNQFQQSPNFLTSNPYQTGSFVPNFPTPNTPLSSFPTTPVSPFSPVAHFQSSQQLSPVMLPPVYPTIQIPAQSTADNLGRGYNPRVDFSPYGGDPSRRAFVGNIERISEDNSMFRKVVFTSDHEQLVAMALQPYEEIGLEVHEDTDQFFRVESGTGVVTLGNDYGQLESVQFGPGDSFQVPAGVHHNVTAETTVKLYTIYSPPHHPYDTIDITKDDARIRGL